ncbi:MAG: hypothetical protein WCJ30_06230, partial [Deltaproteobacteria bacterium]
MNTPPSSEPLPSDVLLSLLMQQIASRRARHWDPLVRVVLAVRAEDVDAQGAIAWDGLSRDALDVPVTEQALRTWLATRPPRAAIRYAGWLFDVRDPRAVTREDLVRLLAELLPDGLPEILGGSVSYDPLVRALYAVAGEALGTAYGTRLVESPFTTFAPAMALCTDDACAAYLRLGAPVMSGHELGQVGFHLLRRGTPSDALRAAYGAAVVSLCERLTNRQSAELYVYTTLMEAAPIEAALRASTKRPKVWARLLSLVCAQGTSQGATAVAALLDDKKLAGHAAAVLAMMGAAGASAARTWLDTHGAQSPRGSVLARTVLAIPATEQTLFAGAQYSLPRFGRTTRQDLHVAPTMAAPTHAPTPLASIEAILAERPVADLLSPEGWADLLQLVAIDPRLSDMAYAWERANARGLLGQGNDPAALMTALDAMDWNAVITRHYPASEYGIGHALLWAGAGRDVYQHAMARFEEAGTGNLLGARARHFTSALELVRPPWAATFQCLARHWESGRDETA